MTMISSAAGQSAFPRFWGGFVRLLGNGVNGFIAFLARREAIKALGEMDDRALRDIGISRSQIEGAVHGVVDPTFGYTR
jgi:uncharacterized protein YjiS (DUF1127 family)